MTKQAEDHHPTAWHAEMSTQEKNTLWASIAVVLTFSTTETAAHVGGGQYDQANQRSSSDRLVF
jgi:hypothetical protein